MGGLLGGLFKSKVFWIVAGTFVTWKFVLPALSARAGRSTAGMGQFDNEFDLDEDEQDRED